MVTGKERMETRAWLTGGGAAAARYKHKVGMAANRGDCPVGCGLALGEGRMVIRIEEVV